MPFECDPHIFTLIHTTEWQHRKKKITNMPMSIDVRYSTFDLSDSHSFFLLSFRFQDYNEMEHDEGWKRVTKSSIFQWCGCCYCWRCPLLSMLNKQSISFILMLLQNYDCHTFSMMIPCLLFVHSNLLIDSEINRKMMMKKWQTERKKE